MARRWIRTAVAIGMAVVTGAVLVPYEPLGRADVPPAPPSSS